MNLTPEQLRAIQAQYTSSSGWTPAMNGAASLDGMNYQRADDLYYGYDPNKKETGDPFQKYGLDGTDQGQGQFHDIGNGLDLLAMGTLAALSMGAFLPGGFAAGGAGGGGAVAGGIGDATTAGYLNGADIMSNTFAANGGIGAGGFGGTSGSYMSNLLNGAGDIASRVAGNTGAANAAGTASTVANAAGTAKAGMSLLGPAATLLGGIAGAQGQENEQSTTRDVPEWLKPYVQKNLGYAGSLLDQQMQPGAMAGYDQMRNVGQGLLSQPMAGNGFSKFFPGR
jgi:hypothetical protein